MVPFTTPRGVIYINSELKFAGFPSSSIDYLQKRVVRAMHPSCTTSYSFVLAEKTIHVV